MSVSRIVSCYDRCMCRGKETCEATAFCTYYCSFLVLGNTVLQKLCCIRLMFGAFHQLINTRVCFRFDLKRLP